jgi:hypothetical protein
MCDWRVSSRVWSPEIRLVTELCSRLKIDGIQKVIIIIIIIISFYDVPNPLGATYINHYPISSSSRVIKTKH